MSRVVPPRHKSVTGHLFHNAQSPSCVGVKIILGGFNYIVHLNKKPREFLIKQLILQFIHL